MSTLKEQKEQFVSDLLGGSISEIYNVTTIALTAYLSYRLFDIIMEHDVSLVYDFLLNCHPILAAITVYSGSPTTLHLAIFVPVVAVYLVTRLVIKDTSQPRPKTTSSTKVLLPKKSFITAYRAHMLIITNLAILAVDFKIFPRRFAKVETWGTSMMDLGVGSFVFSMGLVNSRAIIKNKEKDKLSQKKFSFANYVSVIRRNVLKSIPLLVLGVARLVSVKSLEYQEHVTEYGIHWNFFITLGLLPILLGVLDPILNVVPRALIAFVISGVFEIVLTNTELLTFILRSDNRMENLVTMNKEGIFSFVGYFSIFIFGQSFGSFVLTDYKTPYNLITFIPEFNTHKKKRHSKLYSWLSVSTTGGLIIATLFYHFVFYVVNESTSTLAISRRLANFPYVLWVVSYNASLLLGYNLIEKFVPNSKESLLLESTNSNGLFIFLVANVSTGLINMSINTLECGQRTAFVILSIYGFALCALSIFLNKKGIYIKL
ncbi:GWT1-domain-containing protein [Scheffersomyces xylosifermentans]|uniref:GWT1-domain-containing protein n=1 Tax=Scheffersomyces xylosifermentans TaxID=1304137 RepID=UPI00315CBFB9